MTSSPYADVTPDAHRYIRQQEVIAELGQQALETNDLDQLMHDASVAVAATLDTEYTTVLKLLPGRDQLLLRQGFGWRDGLIGNTTIPTDIDSQMEYTLLSEQPIIVGDLRSEERFSSPELLTSHDAVSGISAIIGSVESPWGVLGTYTTDQREFTKHNASFVQSVANVLASAIEEIEPRQQLRNREAEFEEVYGRVTDGVLAVNDEWELTHVNNQAEEILDVDSDEIMGRKIWNVVPGLIGTEFEAHYREAMATQESISIEEYYSPCDIWLEKRLFPSETGLSVYFRDITEQQHLEEELEQTFDRITDAFIGLDRNWEITYVNERGSEILDPEDQGLVGENFWDPFEPALGTTFEEEYRTAVETQESTSFEEYYPPLDVWFEVHAYPSESGLSIYFRDATERKERERELELFRTLLDYSHDSVLVIDPETGEYIDSNETASQRLGYSQEELLQLAVSDVETEFPDQAAWQSFVDDLKVEGQITFNGTHKRKDRTTYPTEVNLSYVELDQEYVLAIARDVTEHRKRERRLKESEQQYRTLAENFPNGIVTLFDENLRYTLAAGEAFDTFPISAADVEGELFQTVWPDSANEVLEPAFRAALDGEKRVVETEYADREWRVHVVPLTADEGDIFGGLTIAQDITEHKERKRAIEESERRYRTLVENFPNGAVGLFDETLHYTAAGGQLFDTIGIEPEELLGNYVNEIYADELIAGIEPHFQAALGGESRIFEQEFQNRHLLAYTLPVRDVNNDIYAGMLVVQDITERKEYEQKLKESNERLEQFAYAASHDLQEPLRMVTSYLQLLEKRYDDALDEAGEEFLEFAVDGAERMREMINGLLKYSRIDTQGDPFEPVNLDHLVKEVQEDLQIRIEESDAQITIEDLPRVEGDESQLRQVFQNLLANAITYSGDEPPEIHIDAERHGDQWIISVHDEGVGIDPADQHRVFEVFQRLHTQREYTGTGIGLALCQRIVKRHGGQIWVDSEPGEGASFSFTLPILDR